MEMRMDARFLQVDMDRLIDTWTVRSRSVYFLFFPSHFFSPSFLRYLYISHPEDRRGD